MRQPLVKAIVSLASKGEGLSLDRIKPQILEELNVKELEVADSITELDKKEYDVNSEGGYGVAVSTEITPELAAEGLAREIVHRLQNMRRQAGFDIADYIVTCYQGDDYTGQVISVFADYIKRETLSREIVNEAPGNDIFSENYKLSGHDILLGVAKIK